LDNTKSTTAGATPSGPYAKAINGMPTGPTLVNITQGKKACIEAPDKPTNGQATKPLNTINATDANVKDNADTGSKDLADNEIKISAGKARSTTNLLAPAKSGLNLRL
jgi:hypothetical protein